MALPSLLDALRTFLQASLSPAPALVGDGYPIAPAELPAVTISLSGVGERMRGLGRLPAPTMTGALRVDTSLDLANPVVTFPDEVVTLLSDDRRTVRLAHGPLVRADGTATQPLAGDDLRVVRGATTFDPVEGTPAAGQVQVLPDTGELRFSSKLPTSGVLALGYFVGEWEIATARYQGVLTLEPAGADLAGVDALSRQIDSLLETAQVPGLLQLSPTGWGAVGEVNEARGKSRSRALTYRFDYELVEPKLATGGGLIATVSVDSAPGPEQFDVTREGS